MSRWLTRTRETLTNLIRPETKASLAAPDADLLALFGASPTISGASVTPQSAMGVPAVAAAVNLISKATGSMPFKVFSRTDTGKAENPDHPAFKFVHRDANGWLSAGKLRTQVSVDALLSGNGYALANRLSSGNVYELIRLDPSTVTPKLSSVGYEPFYEVKASDGSKRLYDYRDIIHISPITGNDGITGISPIHLAREAIALAIVLEAHAARLFANGARPSGLLSFPGKLGADTAQRVNESWKRAHGGSNAGGTAVLEEGGEFEALTFNSVDAQFEELRHFQIYEIARAFGVAPSFLAELENATLNNFEQMDLQFMRFTLLPWLNAWEEGYSRVLIPEEERGSTFIEFVQDALLSVDTKTRTDAFVSLRLAGIVTTNDVREKLNMQPHPDGDSLANPFTESNPATGSDKPKEGDA